jgi:hypothetical protein
MIVLLVLSLFIPEVVSWTACLLIFPSAPVFTPHDVAYPATVRFANAI